MWPSLLVGRALPLGVFGFIVAIQAELAVDGLVRVAREHPATVVQLHVMNRVLTTIFFALVLTIYLIRGRALATERNPLAVGAAMVGSFILFSLPLVPGRPPSDLPAVLILSNLLLSAGTVLALYGLGYLHRRFSLVPEARGLVRSGPYGVVRHPMYLGELLSATGLILPTLASLHLAIFVIFLGAQLIRMHFEERVLTRIFPEYRAYAQHTSRLIPFLY